MPYDLGVIKRQRREPPVISTGAYGGNFVGFYSTGSNYYAVHVFTSSGQFTKPSYVTTTTAQVLVVAGGGGGATASSSGGSLYFNGVAATKLTTPANAVFSFGTGDFTVEAWIYPTASPSNLGQIIGGHNSGSNADWIFGVLATTNYIVFYGTNGSTNITSVSGVPLNQWTHVAVVVAGTIPKIYFNGVLDKTGTSIGGLGNGIIITVGGDNTGNANAAFTGYITNLRVVKGLAVYSGNFTTPNYMLQSTQSANPGGGSNTQAISTASWTSLILDVLSPTGYIADTGGNTLPITNNASTVVYSSTLVPAFISAISGVGGGGGAGGVINSSTYSISTSLTILIGAGGAVNINGNASTVTNGVTVLTASGGGTGGAPLNNSGTAGSSGGGGSGTGTGGANTSTQGNVGGAGGSQTSYAGGGGGASTAGGAANSGGAGQGGSGTITLITGSPIWLAGGGGGGANATGYNNGSYGGGGNGGTTSVISGTAGLPYTGGGGGGGGASTGFGGNGGSGIVIISYAIPANLYPSIQSDPYFSNNSLLLNATTATAGNSALITYSVFTDVSTYGVSVTSVGSTATTLNSFDPGLYHSLYFSGNNYLLVGVNGNYNFIYSTTALVTIEFWVYPASLSSAPFIFSTNAGNANYFGGGVQITSAGNIAFTISGGSGIFIVQSTSAGTIPTNAWSHVAVTWNYAGNTGAFYINGNQSGTFTRGTGVGVTANSSLALIVGQSGSNSNFYNGYVSNLRLVNGTVVYSGIFIPSKEPLSTIQFAPSVNVATITTGTTALVGKFLTTAQTIADYSTLTNSISNVGAVTASTLNPFTPLVNESAYFNGSSQYLAMPVTGSIFELAGSSFTMECWVYIPTSGGGTIWTLGTTGIFLTTQAGVDGNGSVYFQTGSYAPSSYWFIGWNGMKAATPNSVVTNNTWAHIAFVRDSSTFKIFVNGTQQDSRTFIEPNSIAAGPGGYTAFIGSYYGTSFFTGYISNFRLVRGLAVYSGNFTVPTGPLQVTQVANPYGGSNTQAISTASYTSLLTLRYGTYGVNPSGVIDYGSNNNSIVVTGQPAQGTFSPFGNNWSTFFNGTTDYLSIPVIYSSSATLTSLNFGTNNWTIETWAYLTANTGTAYIAGQLNTNNISPVGLSISANKPVLTISNILASTSPSLTLTSPTALSTGTWNHIAAVRNATRISLYVNGVEQTYEFNASPIADISINTATITSNNVTISILSPYDQSQYHSLYFNGSSYLNLPTSAAYRFSTNNFTAEAWIYRSAAWTAQNILFGQWSGSTGGTTLSWVVMTSNDTNGYARFSLSNTGAAVLTDSVSSTVIPLNQWNHLALVRNGSTFTLYLNGISVVTYSSALALYAATNNLSIGASSLGTQTFTGYISNLRIVKDLALYSGVLIQVPQNVLSTIQSATPFGAIANVTTNTTQLLTGRFINPDVSYFNFFIDYSANSLVVANNGSLASTSAPPISSTSTYNSIYFYTGTNITVVDNNAFIFGTGDFTIETWFNILQLDNNGDAGLFQLSGPIDRALRSISVLYAGQTAVYVYFGVQNQSSTYGYRYATFTLNTWYHIALVRRSNVLSLYINGVGGTLISASSDTTDYNFTTNLTIGKLATSFYLNGYMSNFRIVKGTAVYTGNFNVPNTPLTTTQAANPYGGSNVQAILGGTSLLIAKSAGNEFVVDYSLIPKSITSVGYTVASNVAPPISSPSTYNSLYFYTGTNITVVDNNAFIFGTGDFTIETWVNVSQPDPNGFTGLFQLSGPSDVALNSISVGSSGVIVLVYYGVQGQSTTYAGAGATFTLNTWYHIALVRRSNVLTFYTNGEGQVIAASDTTNYNFTTKLTIGKLATYALFWLNGYMSNFRVVKGLAVYSGNFNVPNTPLTTTQAANPYGGSNVQAISTASYTTLLTLLSIGTPILDYSTNTSVITMGSGTVSLSTLDPFTAYRNYNSVYFGGNGFMSITSSTGWVNYGDHTVETWVNLNTSTYSDMLIAGTYNGVGTTGWEWTINNYNMSLSYRLSNVLTRFTYPATTSSVTFTPGIWYHVAFSRLGTTSSMYINGVRTTSTQITNYTEQNTLRLGYMGFSTATSTYLTGYISNFRVVSGVAVYTGTNFVTPIGFLTTQQPPNPYGGTGTNAITFNTSTRILTALFNGVNLITYSTNTNMLIGRAGSAVTSMFPGYLSNLRIVNGTALYTSAFAPPRAPLPVITNTSLLIAASSYHVDKSVNNFIVTTGTIASLPNITKFTPYKIPGEYNRNIVGGSVYFNTSTAASQNLNIGTAATLALGSGNYTVECWVYAQSYNALNSALIDWRTNAGVTAGVPVLYMLAAGTIQWQNTGGTGFLTSPNAIPLNTWNHVAMVRYNSTLYMYINGVVVASIVDSTTLTIQTLFINSPITASNQTFFGFISNVRILVGRAIYTPTLTVSTTTLTRVTNTVLLALQNDYSVLKDNSTNNFALTKPNTSTVFQQVLSPFGGVGSAYFNGANNYLTITTGTNQAFNFDQGDFTLEAWVYPTARNGTYGSLIIGPVNYPTTINWIWMINPTGYLYIQLSNATAGAGVITSTSQVPLSQWSHVACVRLYGVMTLYINGQAAGSNISAANIVAQSAAGSLSFNGTSQYITAGAASDWTYLHNGLQDYTMECWFYSTTGTYQTLFGTGPVTSTIGFELSIGSGGPGAGAIWVIYERGQSGVNTGAITSTGVWTTNTWNHVAVTFVASTKVCNIFLNGNLLTLATSVITGFAFNTSAPTYPLYIGYLPFNGYVSGYITNLRITKSILYNANFATLVPLLITGYTDILLLVNSDANKLVDTNGKYTLTNNGATYSGSIVPTVNVISGGTSVSTVYAAGSLYFAGGGNNQRLSLPASSAFDLSGGTWTIEFWMYSTATPTVGNQCRMFMFGVNQTTTGFVVGYQNDGSIAGGQPIAQPYVPTNPTVVVSAAGAITLNTWYHVAMVSNAGNTSIYINGSQSGSTVALTEPTSSSPTLFIGYDTVGTVNFQYKGYLTNIRIVNGSAVYTSNFTPTLPLTNVPNTKLLLLVNNGYALTDTSSSPMTVTNSASPVTYSSSVIPSVTIVSGGIATATNTINVGIGAAINGSAATTFNGYITNLNVIKGVGKYTGSFTPPTSDLTTVTNTALLTLLSTDTTFIDRSLNSFAITNSTTATTLQGFSPYTTNYSTYFDGSTYMSLSNAQPFNLSTSTNWTIETWVNPTGNYTVNNILFAKRNTGLTFKSMSFNGTNQFLSISTSTGAFAFGSNDWTIECWFYGSGAIVGRGPSDADDELYIAAFATGQYLVDWGNASEYWQSATGLFATNQWTHLAVVRSSNTLAVYQNGVAIGLSAGGNTISRALTNNYAFRIGQARSAGTVTYFSGYIANFRVVNGLVVYTGNFNPPDGLLSTSQVANAFGGINTQAISTSTSTTLLIGQFNTSNSISDLSTYSSLVTNNNTVFGSVTGPIFYNSIQFNGTSQYLQVAVGGAGSALDLSAATFTIEAWIYPTTTVVTNAAGQVDIAGVSAAIISSQSHGDWNLCMLNGGIINFNNVSGTSPLFLNGGTVVAGRWSHVAVTRVSSSATVWVNGVGTSGTVFATSNSNANILGIGRFGTYSEVIRYWNGYISNFRIIKGLVVYTTSTSFTAPTAPLSKYIPTIGTSSAGSVSFSFVSGAAVDFTNSTFATGTGDFTAECWVYMDPSSSIYAGFMTSVSSSIAGWNICRDFVGLVPANGSGPNDALSWTVPTGVWTHVALTLRSGQVQAWLNGVGTSILTRTYVTPSPSATTIRLAGRYTSDTAYPFIGYISNARFVVGVGVYTGNFTVPTTQLQTTQFIGTNIQAITDATSVRLLTAQTNSIADLSPAATSVSITGSVGTTYAYNPTLTAPSWAMGMLGSYLTIPANAAFQFGTGDFTIECWFYWSGTAPADTNQYTLISNLVSSSNITWDLQYYNGNWRLAAWSPTFLQGASSSFVGNTWYHIAVTRVGGFGQIWLNGASVTGGPVAFATDLSTIAQVRVGWNGTNQVWGGYVSNVRIVKGLAVYTGAFTPPTSMLRSTQVGSGNIQSISTASYVSLLSGQSNSVIIDNSKNSFIITNVTGVGVISSSPFATASTYDASYTSLLTSNFIGTATTIKDNSSNLYTITQIGSPPISTLSPFGVVYATTSTSYQGYLSSSTGYLGFYNGTTFSTSTTALSTGTWNHVAYTYDSSVSQGYVNIYVNGFRVYQTTATIRADASENLHIGGVYGVTENFYGYLSNFRVVKDSSLYLGSYFGVPSAKLNITTDTIPYPLTSTISTSLLTLQDNRIVDNSINAYSLTVSGTPKTITFSPFATNSNISAYFNGTSDFINVQAQAALSLGIADFTIEVWVYPTAVPTAYAGIIEARAAVAATPWVVGLRTSAGVLKTDFYDGTARTAATTIQLNVWTHLAWSRTNSILRMFVNGQIDYTLANYTTNLPAQTTNQFIGKIWDGANSLFQGYMSNLRVVNGRSLYTGNFNPSQIPLTQASGGTTNLLTTFVDGKLIDYSGNTAIRSTTSTFNLTNIAPKYNLYSMNFNGTSDILTVSSSTGFVYNSNDFTWEMWVYPTSPIWATTSTYFIEHGINGGSLRYANNKVFYSNITTATSTASFTLSINSSTWTHLAVVRASNVTSVFINGAFTVNTLDTYRYNTSTIVTIGNTSTNASNYFQGYIEDLRITKGIARYLTTFVPPTKLSNR